MYNGLAGKICVVTGAAGAGIGQATARRLAVEGCVVVVTDNHRRRNDAVTAALAAEFPGRVHGRVMDVTDSGAVDETIAFVVAELGGVDVLVNNAAVNPRADVVGYEPDTWRQVLEADLTAPWYLARKVIPAMRARGGGSVINISSVAAFLSGAMEAPYAAAKAGLNSLTRAVAAEYGAFGIRSNCVAPGLVESKYVEVNIERFTEIKEKTPLRRFAQPSEVAAVVAYLASDDASFITGETISVTGGWYMRG